MTHRARLEPQVRCMNICASTDGARRAQNCALYTSVCFVVFMQLFAMCSRLLKLCVKMYAVCRSHLCIVKCSSISGAGYILFTPPVGDSRLPSAVTDLSTVKNSKFFCTLRLFPQIDIEPPRNRLPCAISGHTIFEASTQNQTPTSLHANAKKTGMRNFALMFLVSFCPLLASGVALSTTHF